MSIYVFPLLCRKHRPPCFLSATSLSTLSEIAAEFLQVRSAFCLSITVPLSCSCQVPEACPDREWGALCLSFLFGALLTWGWPRTTEAWHPPSVNARGTANSIWLFEGELANPRVMKAFQKRGIWRELGFRDVNNCVELGWIQNNVGP